MDEPAQRLRIDKWLWAARFMKTRTLASEAVAGGRVQVNGQRAKPSKEVGPGDTLQVTIGQVRRTVVVRGVAARRGPASEAVLLYEETDESLAERERLTAERRLSGAARGGPRHAADEARPPPLRRHSGRAARAAVVGVGRSGAPGGAGS